MRVVFLEGSRQGLSWFQVYYQHRPELDANAAWAAFDEALETLKSQPFSAQKYPGHDGVFEKKILRSAFSILFTVRNDTIFVIDIHDQRGMRSAHAIRTHKNELRRKYGLD